MIGSVKQVARRATAAGLLAAVAALVPAQAARADVSCAHTSPCVIVRVVGGPAPATSEFSVSDVTANSVGPPTGPYWPYATRNDVGISGDAHAVTALPLWNLLLMAGVNPRGVDYTSVPTQDPAAPSILDQSDLAVDGDNFKGNLPPAVYVNTGQLAYIRPLRNDTDVNAEEYQLITGGAIVVTAYLDKPPLQVTLSSSATSVHVHDKTTFTAGVSRTNASVVGPVDYQWDFGGTTRSTRGAGATVSRTVTWQHAGTYYVSVNAHDRASQTYGRSPTALKIQVGPPTKPHGSPHHPGTGDHPHPHHPPSGPNHGHGHHPNGSPPKPHHPQHANQGQTSGDPTSTSHSGTSSRHHQKGAHHQSTSDGRTKQHSSPPGQGGQSVTGQLLDGAQVFVAPAPTRSLPQVEPAQARPRDSWSLPWRIVGGVGVPLMLIGLGMAGEALQLRRRVARMSA
ncbi:MAG TPA: PKD domain-containing protein [Nocardioides sp.]|nr:PKD domain-containing protein [Nocardioides sp.]